RGPGDAGTIPGAFPGSPQRGHPAWLLGPGPAGNGWGLGGDPPGSGFPGRGRKPEATSESAEKDRGEWCLPNQKKIGRPRSRNRRPASFEVRIFRSRKIGRPQVTETVAQAVSNYWSSDHLRL